MSIKNVYDEEEMEKIILRPYHYLLQTQVYDLLITKLVPSLDFWLKIPKSKLEQIQDIMTLISHSSAMFDDVEDNSLFRRFLPAAHCVFGTAMTLNCSFHTHMLALEKVLQLGHPKAAEVYCKGMLGFIRGTSIDLYWRDNQTDISHDHYKQMSTRKNGGQILMLYEWMQLFSNNKTDYGYIITLFSVYYQIRDDYCNLKKPQALEEPGRNKELQDLSNIDFCEDLTDGKISFPVIHAIKTPSRDVILGLLKMHTRDVRVKKYLLSLLEQTGALQYTGEVLREMEEEMYTEIKRLGGNPILEKFLEEFKNWDEHS